DGKADLALLKAGDLFLLPANVPHSPRRADSSWTFVVERTRRPEEQDRFVWICEECGNTLHETTVRFDEPSDAVATATAAMKADPKLATCTRCGEVLDL
ncbi:MAG TPA: 3-hydroxyanthranilate 3,4-dioxygenase, partial [Candidatus Binatia bacterium]